MNSLAQALRVYELGKEQEREVVTWESWYKNLEFQDHLIQSTLSID